MLALKLMLVPALVAFVSLAGQRFGYAIAGMLAGFPIVAGPIFVLLSLEHGDAFGAEIATGTLIGLLSLTAFATCYSWLCRAAHWLPTLLLSWLAFAAVTLVLMDLKFGLLGASVAGALVPLLGYRLFPAAPWSARRPALPRSELLLRMISAGALVVAVTEAAALTGPKLAGLLTPFPVSTSVLTAFAHGLGGASAANQLLRGIFTGLYGFVAFFICAAALLPAHGLATACAVALVAALVTQGLVYRYLLRFKALQQ